MNEGRFHRHNVPAARQLRRRLTPSESLLWNALRDRRFLGLKFRRQHPVGAFVLDFFCAELNLAIEVDGPIHLDGERRARDLSREEILREAGIHFWRVPAHAVEKELDAVLAELAQVAQSLHARTVTSPHPGPLPACGERE